MTQQWKYVKARYYAESVFVVPAHWDEEEIYVKWNTLNYKNASVEPAIDAHYDNDYFKRPDDDIEITAEGDEYSSTDNLIKQWLEENEGAMVKEYKRLGIFEKEPTESDDESADESAEEESADESADESSAEEELVCPKCGRTETECEKGTEEEKNPVTEWCGWGLSCDDCYYKAHPESDEEEEPEPETNVQKFKKLFPNTNFKALFKGLNKLSAEELKELIKS